MFTSSSLAPISPTSKLFLSSPKPPSPTAAISPRRTSITVTAAAATAAPSFSAFVESIPVNGHKTMSLYEILRIKKTASQMEIKTAYRSLAKIYHPDAVIHEVENESDGCDFIEIHNAYETLSDPVARALYDLSLDSDARKRRQVVVGFNGGNYPTRRWETDQCW